MWCSVMWIKAIDNYWRNKTIPVDDNDDDDNNNDDDGDDILGSTSVDLFNSLI